MTAATMSLPRTPTFDVRRPLVIDTRPLGRRPGSLSELERTILAPDNYGLDLIAVPRGAQLAIEMRLEAVLDGVLVTADVHAPVRGECVRCLEPVDSTVSAHLVELWSYPEQAHRFARTAGPAGDGADLRQLDGDLLDLEPALRDAICLALPASPLCRPDCGGLCVACGIRLDDAGPGHQHAQTDPRWAALGQLTDTVAGPGPGPATPTKD